jgi:CBS domain containing-hemolysin-like protein
MGSVPLGFLITTSVIFIIVAAILVAAESSLSRLSKAAVEDLIEEGQKRAKRLDTLLDQRRSTALSVRAGRIALQTAAAVAITIAFTHGGWPWWVILLLSIGVNWLVAYFVISVIPQQIAWRNPEKVALHTTPLLEFMLKAGRLGSPIVELFRKVLPASPQTDAEARAEMTEEMREVVDQVGETEGFEFEDREMLRAVFELGHTYIREVMVPRTDMVTIQADVPVSKAIALFVRSGYSRIPVIGENVDDVVGIM